MVLDPDEVIEDENVTELVEDAEFDELCVVDAV